MEIVESSDDVFWDVARVVFPLDNYLFSVGDRFYCGGVGCRSLSALAAFMADFDVGVDDVLLHFKSAPASSHSVVEEEDSHCFTVSDFGILFVIYS